LTPAHTYRGHLLEQKRDMTGLRDQSYRIPELVFAFVALYAALALPVLLGGGPIATSMAASTIVLAAGLASLSAIDAQTLRLPDALTLPLAALGLVLAATLGWEPPLIWRMAAAVGGYLAIWAIARAYQALRGRAGMGLGDAKLMAVAGAWLGPDGVPAVLLYGCATALMYVAFRSLARRPIGRDEPLAFGPFLAFGIWLVWLYGPLV
jgi:leader peptidase (prepilin peptidase) / N-methyltransferase